MSVASKVVVITGASSGIGAGAATHLASIGYKQLTLVARRRDRLEEVAAECRAKGATSVLLLVKDLSLTEDCKSTIDDTIAHFGQLDVLVANAGVAFIGSTRTLELEHFEKIFKLNVTANFLLTKHSLPHLEKTKGTILITSSISDTYQCDVLSAYNASKAAVTQFAQCVASEEAKKGIRINVLCPGFVLTEMTMNEKFEDQGHTQEEKEASAAKRLGKYQPLGRPGRVEEMAKLVAFLISDENSFMTGARIVSDGGFLVKNPLPEF